MQDAGWPKMRETKNEAMKIEAGALTPALSQREREPRKSIVSY
jgi:hypothetical protein